MVHAACLRREAMKRAQAALRLHVVEVVGLKMIFEAAVAGARREQQVNTVTQEMERRADKRQVGQDARDVVEVLDGMHAEAGKWLDVSVAVVQRMHEGEDGLEVKQAVGKVKVYCKRACEAGGKAGQQHAHPGYASKFVDDVQHNNRG